MKPTNDIKIESGVPIPMDGRSGRHFPFEKLKVGDSFEVEATWAAIYQSSRRYKLRGGAGKFTVRKTPKGARIWRVK